MSSGERIYGLASWYGIANDADGSGDSILESGSIAELVRARGRGCCTASEGFESLGV